MCPLAQVILALAIAHAPPGRSPYSFERLAECGTDSKNPTCDRRPVCEELSPYCGPPRWSKVRLGWVRVESRETAIRRYARIAEAAASSAKRIASCTTEGGVTEGGVIDAGCERTAWPDDEKSLALAGLTVALHESGLREDVMNGHPPLGRGPAGEACLVQVAVDQAPLYAHWLPPAERTRIARSLKDRERFAKTLLGDSKLSLERCFEVGMRMLVRSRHACSKARVPWEHGMFAMYGSGARCHLPVVADKRQRTFERLRFAKPILDRTVAELVDWKQCPENDNVRTSGGLSMLLP